MIHGAAKKSCTGATSSAGGQNACLQILFKENISERNYFATRVLRKILEDHPDEVAITEGMVEDFISMNNPQHFGVREILRQLKTSGMIAKDRTARTKNTRGHGYRILVHPDPDEEQAEPQSAEVPW